MPTNTQPTSSPLAPAPQQRTAANELAEFRDRMMRGALAAGLSQASAELFARGREDSRRKEILGREIYTTVNAAHFMAACLRMKRMPRGAVRAFAQDALATWWHALPPAELRELADTLRKCAPTQLGPDLTALLASHSSK